jgi:cyclic beta-1,2-glucan synthetase
VPGVRENGGQYTHAAIWTVMAFAKSGRINLAWELFSLLNPIHHAETAAKIATYKVEPYVMAADVYAVNPHVGRGGWTWYTGSAGWMYRLVIESLLGLSIQGNQLHVQPRVPASWRTYKIHYRYRETQYHLTVKIEPAISPVGRENKDGDQFDRQTVELVDDRKEHPLELIFGRESAITGKADAAEMVHFGK